MILRIIQILLSICAIASPVWLSLLVKSFAVNVPFGDEWSTPGNIFSEIYYQSRYISFSDLIAQHNEARPLFPKIVFIATAYTTHWDTRYEMAIIFSMACLISINLFYVARKTIEKKGVLLWILMALTNLLIFSPAQYENWLWGFQIVIIVPILCLTTGIRVCYSNIKVFWKVLFCACLSSISTYSFANGLLCWALLPFAFVLSGQWSLLKNRIGLIIFWCVASTSNLALYFWNYVKPGHHPSLAESLFHPLKAFNYFVVFLGSSLSGGDLTIASIVGFFTMFLFGGVLVFLASRWHDAKLRYRFGAWLTVSTYAFISATVTTFGRIGFGIEQALASRYTIFSVCAIVGLIGLMIIVVDEIPENEIQISVKPLPDAVDTTNEIIGTLKRNKSFVLPSFSYKFSVKRLTRYLSVFLILVLSSLHVAAQGKYTNAMDMMHRDRLYAKVCVTYADFVEDRCITQSLSNLPDTVRKNLKAARELGILKQENFSQSAKLVNAQNNSLAPYDHGWIDNVQPVGKGDFLASGWATLKNPGRTASAVLLSYEDNNGDDKVFTVAPVKFDRPDVDKVKQNSAYTRSGWAIQFSRSTLPNRKVKIKAWAYDVKTKSSYPLSGSHTLIVDALR